MPHGEPWHRDAALQLEGVGIQVCLSAIGDWVISGTQGCVGIHRLDVSAHSSAAKHPANLTQFTSPPAASMGCLGKRNQVTYIIPCAGYTCRVTHHVVGPPWRPTQES